MNHKKMAVLLETVNYCNLRCPACPWHSTMTRERRQLLPAEFEKIFEHISAYANSICFYVMGEPLLNAHLFDYILTAHNAGIHTGISTNGMLLNAHIEDVFRSGLDFIQIAVDGLSAETHERYRVGSDYAKIMENLHHLAHEKKLRKSQQPEIHIQTLISRYTENQLPEFRAFAEQLGATFSAKKMMFGKTEDIIQSNRAVFEPEQRKYRRLNNPNLEYFRDMAACPQLDNITILCNGDVVPCCYDYDGKVVFGNLIRQTWEEIVDSGTISEFERKRRNNTTSLCMTCDMVVEKKKCLPSAVLFDFGRTLVIMPDIDIRRGIFSLLQALGQTPSTSLVEQYYAQREQFVSQNCIDKKRRMVYPEILVMMELFRRFQIQTDRNPVELEQLFSDGCSKGMPTAGSTELLKKLQSLGIATGIITNNRYSEETVRWKMRKLFPDHEFSLILSSTQENAYKPDSSIFQTALNKLHVPPEEVWFVGDSVEDDVKGSAGVGMRPFWYVKHAKVGACHESIGDICTIIHEWTDLEAVIDDYIEDR